MMIWNSLVRTGVVAAVAVACLAAVGAPAVAAGDTHGVTVTDRPGAPRAMLQQLADLTGQPLGTLARVVAVDPADKPLNLDNAETLAVGGKVDGVTVLGVLPGSEKLLDTTLADLSDGVFDGSGADGPSTSALIFLTGLPGDGWCLTMCAAKGGDSIYECLRDAHPIVV